MMEDWHFYLFTQKIYKYFLIFLKQALQQQCMKKLFLAEMSGFKVTDLGVTWKGFNS